MADTQVIDGEAVDEQIDFEPGTDVVPATPPTTVAVAPQVEAAELVQRLAVIREAMETAMVQDVDYGVIPGTNKPTLYKPGSEKLSVLFQLDVQLVNEKRWGPGDHLTVVSHATVYHIPTGARMGYGEGVCSTREKKYGKRQAQLVCPHCESEAVIKGKAEYGGGWLCWNKKGGCGAKFADGDPVIESQERGEVENPDVPDTWNTIVKMAEKRARIDAVLAVTGASALFTQDLDDQVEQGAKPDAAPSPPRPAEPPRQPRPAALKQRLSAAIEKSGLTPAEASAVRVWWTARCGKRAFDRLTVPELETFSAQLEAEAGAQVLLAEISARANEGDQVATTLMRRIGGES